MHGSVQKSPPQLSPQVAPNEEKKKRPVVDAFGELMSSAKRIKTTPKTTPKPTINAFDRMMQSAKKPGAFCSVSTASIMAYLEGNPCLREILGEFIDSESCDKTTAAVQHYENDNEVPHKEDISVVANNMERFEGGYLSYDSDPDDYDGDSFEHRRLAQVWQIDKLRVPVDNPNAQVHSNERLPPPPTMPSSDAALIAVHVHFAKYRYASCVKGFTMIYDDDVEITIGQVDGTKAAELKLNRGEHIVDVQAHHHSPRPHYMEYIGFRTTQDRWLTAKGGEVVSDIVWTEREWTRDHEKQKRLPLGMALRSIDFDPERLPPMSGLVTVPLDDLKASAKQADGIPSLQTLIQDQTEAYFKEEASKTCQSALEELTAFNDESQMDIYTYSERLKCKLQRSPEASLIRFLDHLRERTVRRLERKTKRLEARAEQQRRITNASFQTLKTESKARWQQEQGQIYANHLAFHEMNARLSAKHDDVDVGGSNERLCLFPKCRRAYYPHKVPAGKRCAVEGCTSAYQTCGCLMEVCSVCHKTICPWHTGDHFTPCRKSAPQKCGYDARADYRDGPILTPGCCQRLDQSLHECFWCKTKCCVSCGDTCSCGSFWCKGCLDPTNPPAESCCRYCDFHTDTHI